MESRLDTLAKLLASGMSRREALRQIGGSAAGAALVMLGLGCSDDVVGPRSSSALRPRLAKAPGEQEAKKVCHQFCKDATGSSELRKACEDVCEACEGNLAQVCPQTDGTFKCCAADEVCGPTGCEAICPLVCPTPSGVGTVCCPATLDGAPVFCFVNEFNPGASTGCAIQGGDPNVEPPTPIPPLG